MPDGLLWNIEILRHRLFYRLRSIWNYYRARRTTTNIPGYRRMYRRRMRAESDGIGPHYRRLTFLYGSCSITYGVHPIRMDPHMVGPTCPGITEVRILDSDAFEEVVARRI